MMCKVSIFCLFFFLVSGIFADEKVKKILDSQIDSVKKISSKKKVCFVWSKNDHPINTHGYKVFAQKFQNLLSSVENIEAVTNEGFPKAEDWESFDLVVFYVTIPNLSKENQAVVKKYIKRGGGLMVLHQALVQRKTYKDWAQLAGYSYNWDSSNRSRYGRLDKR